MAKDYYNVLGIDKKSTKDDVKKAFRKLAQRYHPDKGGDEAKFKEITEAYAVLGDEKRRREYDTYGQSFAGGGGRPSRGSSEFDFNNFRGFGGGNGMEFDFGDIFEGFEDIFEGAGVRGSRRGARHGRDISIDIQISFKESVLGGSRSVLIAKVSSCEICKSTGAKPGTELETCKTCSGTGRVHETRNTILGQFTSARACVACEGAGKIPKEKCAACGGRGVSRREEEVRLFIPAGIDNGEMIRLPRQGEAVKSGIAGDLYVKVHVLPHPVLRKEGADLIMELPLKLSDALLGTTASVKTIDDTTLEVRVPPLSSAEETLRIRGKGVHTEQGRGDLLIRVSIALPKKLSPKAKKAIEELKTEGF